MSKNQERNAELPQDILDKIAEYLKNVPEKLAVVLCFFSLYEEAKTNLQILRTVFNNEKAFNGIVDQLVEDTEKLKKDPNFLKVLADIWNFHLKPNEKTNVGDGQRFDFQLVLSDTNLINKTATYTLIGTISKLDPTVQNKAIQLIINAAEATVGSELALSQSFRNLLQLSKSTAGKIVSVGLVAIFLTREAIASLKLWWRGEISGIRCTKNIIDSIAGMAGGISGGMAGAAIGSLILPGIGTAIGATVGGIAGSALTSNLSDWLTQKLFNLPKDVALENAYKFLGLEYGASNTEINSRFRHLALQYHPDKGGNKNDWDKLQVSMGLIKLSKGEI